MNTTDKKPNIERAVEVMGSQAALARALKITRQTVRVWLIKGIVPAKEAPRIERVTGGKVTAQSLVNDIVERYRLKVGGKSASEDGGAE